MTQNSSSGDVSHGRLVDKIRFLETFRRIDPNMPVSQILFLLEVARTPDSSLKALCNAAGVPYGSASRYLTALSTGRPAVGQEGLGFVDAIENPRDRKYKIISLTDKGREVLKDVV